MDIPAYENEQMSKALMGWIRRHITTEELEKLKVESPESYNALMNSGPSRN